MGMLALLALQLKNTLYSRDESLKTVYQERWLRIPEDARAHIKNNVCRRADRLSHRFLRSFV